MGKSARRRKRRLRRTVKAVLKFGTHAKRRHIHPSGRTGKIFSSQLQPPTKRKPEEE
jgi:hypothetical protein